MAAKKATRRKSGKKAPGKVDKVMNEHERGTLKSGHAGKEVASRTQAAAIGPSEAGRTGAKLPRKRSAAKRRKKSGR